MDISKKRVTVRKFSQKPVEEEKVNRILEAGRWSPTAVNLQPPADYDLELARKPF